MIESPPMHVYATIRWAITLLEAVGTLLVWLDTARLNARNPRNGFMFGEPEKYKAWYYHLGLYGFALLFIGILLQGALNWSAT